VIAGTLVWGGNKFRKRFWGTKEEEEGEAFLAAQDAGFAPSCFTLAPREEDGATVSVSPGEEQDGFLNNGNGVVLQPRTSVFEECNDVFTHLKKVLKEAPKPADAKTVQPVEGADDSSDDKTTQIASEEEIKCLLAMLENLESVEIFLSEHDET